MYAGRYRTVKLGLLAAEDGSCMLVDRLKRVVCCSEASSTCVTPMAIEGYTIDAENDLRIEALDVSVRCANGYVGSAQAVPCAAADTSYMLHGCNASNVTVVQQMLEARLSNMSEDLVEQVALSLVPLTDERQLSAETINVTIGILNTLTSPSVRAILTPNSVTAVCTVVSNVLLAVEETNGGTTVTDELADVVSNVADRLSTEATVQNGDAVRIEVPAFTLEVVSIGSNNTGPTLTVGEGVADIPAAVVLPYSEVFIHTIAWTVNPFTGNAPQPIGDSSMKIQSRIVTINVRDSNGHPVTVSNLSDPIHVKLLTAAITSPETAGSGGRSVCDTSRCLNTYDVAQQSAGACASLLSQGYSCATHFCDNCLYAGFCDRECGVHSCLNGSDILPVEHAEQCVLENVTQCAFFDTRAKRWQLDGEVIQRSDEHVICAYTHLTDFAACTGTPPQANTLAPLRDTFDVAGFIVDNPVGLILCIGVLSLVVVCAFRSARMFHRAPREIDRRQLARLAYVIRQKGLQNDRWPILEMTRTELRTHYTCGSIWYPIHGDPIQRAVRLFILVATTMCSLGINLMFFQTDDDALEICEHPSGYCTLELYDSGQCQCSRFDCSVEGCNDCALCVNLSACRHSCPTFARTGLYAEAIVAGLILGPITFLLNFAFKWLHRPSEKAIADMIIEDATETDEKLSVDSSTHHDEQADRIAQSSQTAVRQVGQMNNWTEGLNSPSNEHRVVVRTRPPWANIATHWLALTLCLASVWIIASVSRRLSSTETVEWLKSVTRTLAIKWLVMDPVKIIIFSPLKSASKRYGGHIQMCHNMLHICCLGQSTGSVGGKFKHAVSQVVVAQQAFHRVERRMISDEINNVRVQSTMELQQAHEISMSKSTRAEIQEWLRVKRDRQMQEIEARVARIEKQMQDMYDRDVAPQKCLEAVDGVRSVTDKHIKRAHELVDTMHQEKGAIEALQRARMEEASTSLEERRRKRHELNGALNMHTRGTVERVAALQVLMAEHDAATAAAVQEQDQGRDILIHTRIDLRVADHTNRVASTPSTADPQHLWRAHVRRVAAASCLVGGLAVATTDMNGSLNAATANEVRDGEQVETAFLQH